MMDDIYKVELGVGQAILGKSMSFHDNSGEGISAVKDIIVDLNKDFGVQIRSDKDAGTRTLVAQCRPTGTDYPWHLIDCEYLISLVPASKAWSIPDKAKLKVETYFPVALADPPMSVLVDAGHEVIVDTITGVQVGFVRCRPAGVSGLGFTDVVIENLTFEL
jgi:hypothetical protein